MFHALSGSACIRARAKGREKSPVYVFMAGENIFLQKGERRKKKDCEITGDGKSDEAPAAIRKNPRRFTLSPSHRRTDRPENIRKRRHVSRRNHSLAVDREKGHTAIVPGEIHRESRF